MCDVSHLCFTELAFEKVPYDLWLVIQRKLSAIARQDTKFYPVKQNTDIVIFERYSLGYQSIILSFCFPFFCSEPTATSTEHKSSVVVSETTEPATATQPQSTMANITSSEAPTTQPQGTTAEIPTTEGPYMECGVVIVGGGKIAYYCYHCKI